MRRGEVDNRLAPQPATTNHGRNAGTRRRDDSAREKAAGNDKAHGIEDVLCVRIHTERVERRQDARVVSAVQVAVQIDHLHASAIARAPNLGDFRSADTIGGLTGRLEVTQVPRHFLRLQICFVQPALAPRSIVLSLAEHKFN